jgi:hypothetical protein
LVEALDQGQVPALDVCDPRGGGQGAVSQYARGGGPARRPAPYGVYMRRAIMVKSERLNW